MNSFIEKLKDFIYDSIDYLIIIAIIISVVFVIGWRLDILFAKDNLETNAPPIVIDNTDDNNKDDDIAANPDLPPDDNKEPSNEPPDIVDNPDPVVPDPEPTTVTITIPDGTLPSGIGSILESKGLISNKNDFVIQAQSMGLDRNLKSGTFEILSNSSMEEIVKIIARQN